MLNLISNGVRVRNSMTYEKIPVAQNMSYSSHCARNAAVEHSAEEGDYELIEGLPYQPYENVQPPSSTCH